MQIINKLQQQLSYRTFDVARAVTELSNRSRLPVLSTGRTFRYYRQAFFESRSETEVFQELQDKIILDIGCGLTPFVKGSFFQRCHDHNIQCYGVDPKIAHFDYTWLDELAVWAMRGQRIDRQAPGSERHIGAYAHDLPLQDQSVDLVLSSWFLFVWIREQPLYDILQELHRVLKPGGQVRIAPTPWLAEDPWRQWIPNGFDVEQQFHITPRIFHRPPAYTTVLTSR